MTLRLAVQCLPQSICRVQVWWERVKAKHWAVYCNSNTGLRQKAVIVFAAYLWSRNSRAPTEKRLKSVLHIIDIQINRCAQQCQYPTYSRSCLRYWMLENLPPSLSTDLHIYSICRALGVPYTIVDMIHVLSRCSFCLDTITWNAIHLAKAGCWGVLKAAKRFIHDEMAQGWRTAEMEAPRIRCTLCTREYRKRGQPEE